MGKFHESTWKNDSKPHTPPKACLLWVMYLQWMTKLTVLILAIANISLMASRGFFYIDSSNQVSYGGCFSRGDLFSLCINGMAISAVSVLVASLFSLKDFIMLALNSCSWTRVMLVVEAATFLVLAVWWAISSALYFATVRSAITVGTPVGLQNSSVQAPDLSQDMTARSGMNVLIGIQFTLLAMSITAVIQYGITAFCRFLPSRSNKGVGEEKLEMA